MLTSSDGYNWIVTEDKHYLLASEQPETTLHGIYGVDWICPNKSLYSFDSEPGFEAIKSTYKREDGKTVNVEVLYTGKEYFKFEDVIFSDEYDDNNIKRALGDFDRSIYRSYDYQNWEYITTQRCASNENLGTPFPGRLFDVNTQIINTGKEYLVRLTDYDYHENIHNYWVPVMVYNYNLNYLKTVAYNSIVEDADKIVDMSYIDDTYYLTTKNNITYKSIDLDNWEVVGKNLGCPMKNSLTTLYKTRLELKGMYELSLSNFEGPITSKDNQPDKNVLEEGIMLFGTRKYGDFFVCFNNLRDSINDYTEKEKSLGLDGKFLDIYRDSSIYKNHQVSFSKDGVYWSTFEIPWLVDNIDTTSEGIVIECIRKSNETALISIKFSDMEKVVPKCNIKVELNNRILGFSQPPIMENDRTLVPMRFLFEQMGADVKWDDTTQTATATVPVNSDTQMRTFSSEAEKSVTFSIDDTTATVNGKTATMDVPARLVNDKTMVPLRFLSENLGYNVEWDESTNTAIITTK